MSVPAIRVRVSGDYACFTRPETKVERFSYPIITPSAARNILDAICWRPQMRWVVQQITILKPVRYLSVLRNEVQSKISPAAVKKWIRDPNEFAPLIAGAGQGTDSTPRNTTLLRDVAYWIDAKPRVFDNANGNSPVKYVEMFNRRVEKGQCFERPYLGCREFAAEFGPPCESDQPIPDSFDVGRMLYDIAFLPEGNRAVFFEAKVVEGVLDTRPEVVLGDAERREEVTQCSYRP